MNEASETPSQSNSNEAQSISQIQLELYSNVVQGKIDECVDEENKTHLQDLLNQIKSKPLNYHGVIGDLFSELFKREPKLVAEAVTSKIKSVEANKNELFALLETLGAELSVSKKID